MNRDAVIDAISAAPRPERSALLVAAHAAQLRPLERIGLLLRAPKLTDLLRLSHYEVELTIGRPLRGLPWRPATLLPLAERDSGWLARADHHLWWIGDADYPPRLRLLFDPPAILFGRGAPAPLAGRAVAVVGTRRPTPTARSAAFRMGVEIAAAGVPLVSGLALGIDGAAHEGTASVAGAGIAVLGSGIDAVTPRANRPIAAALLACGGLILSEYPPGVPPARYHFPARNRLIAALSSLLVVTEAPEGSGALISVEHALDLGIDVAVDRAGIASGGCRALVADGAAVVSGANDVLVMLDPHGAARAEAPVARRAPAAGSADRDRRMLSLFGDPDMPGSLEAARYHLSHPERAGASGEAG